MNETTNRSQLCCAEEISFCDIWKSLVEHKKKFWIIFFMAFILGSIWVWLTPQKYNFSQVIEVGRYIDDGGQIIPVIDLDKATDKIKFVLFPQAVRSYTYQATNKMYSENERVKIEKAGENGLVLTIVGKQTDFDKYKFIFQHITDGIANETKAIIELRKKSLNRLKDNLDHRLVELKEFYSWSSNGKAFVGSAKKHTERAFLEERTLTMYLNDQNATMNGLIGNISRIEEQLEGFSDTRITYDFHVSDDLVGLSKLALLVLVVIVSFFLAFFGVFVFMAGRQR